MRRVGIALAVFIGWHVFATLFISWTELSWRMPWDWTEGGRAVNAFLAVLSAATALAIDFVLEADND